MFYGILGLPWWSYILIALMFIHFTVISITLYLHRCQAHRALTLHPALCHIFRFWLWLTTAMLTKEWAAIHRKHHAHCETSDDPHSPVILGISTVLWQGAELYRKEKQNTVTLERFGAGTPDDWIERNLYTKYRNLGLIIMLAMNILFFGIPGITIWGFQMLFTPLCAAGIINGIGHYWGYRNYECKDAARNILPWGIFLGGEELHNNHHTYATSAKFSVKYWEFDIGWWYIKLLTYFRLAKVKRIPPQLHQDPSKRQIDIETIRAIILHRFQILSKYGREVVLPVIDELKLAREVQKERMKGQFYKLLMREDSLLQCRHRQKLNELLKKYDVLHTVYAYRKTLQAIWESSTQQATPIELVERLQGWCREAEATKIKALSEFARSVKSFSREPDVAKCIPQL